ncbi:hypothetical protein BKA67DRAFT_301004 [Truncatella angustata]|uniref:UBA domain-containing protein 3 n=1 Tax=Truncatella angustata TaxID=152316 RepID=A0A9P8UI27_9PEZI|nr:uncharacterized protein BKA67DRAFT_301004 [Truncatella angustata]KAH6652763.1 hypothetical protein BKA67DRAFT_301004 [Truncatella angustata]
MASLMSKRQQARNEKALQDLVHDVPGNNSCADCSARNPAWASWSLGIFLCMRCGAIHRKLGTHISKVKSLSMDGWTNEQVDNMKRVGNTASNKKYNPDNKKPPVPVDADEADSAMERFIRSKYTQRASESNGSQREREQTQYRTERPSRGRADSDLETPPPVPSKTGGFFKKSNSKSSTFPLFRSKKSASSQHIPEEPRSPPPLRNKPSKVFGASVQNDSVDDTARKLTQLRDMGFTDDKRNAMVLKGVNGNVERTIETLVRLGEGGTGDPIPRRGSSLQTPSTLATPRSLSPSPATPTTAGLSRMSPSTANSPATSNNPWDISPAPAPPQTAQSTGTMPSKNPFYAMTTNPFGVPSQQSDYNLNSSMQNLSLAPSQPQQLFPHHTGGLPAPPNVQQPIYQQSMTPPIPQTQNFASFFSNGNQASYQQPYQQSQPQPQPQVQPQQTYNPFLQSPAPQQQQQQQQQQSLSVNIAPLQNQNTGSNPFARSPTTRIGSSPLGQIPEQSQQNFYGTPTSPYGNNPFLAMNQPAQQPQYQAAQPFDQSMFQVQQQAAQQPQYQAPQLFDQSIFQVQPQTTQQPQYQSAQQFDQSVFQPQQQQAQPVYQPPRDKATIMALYNYPSVAPTPLQPQSQMPINDASNQLAASQQQPLPLASPLQSVAHPKTTNPFLNGGASPPSAHFATVNNAVPFGSARSRESMTLGAQMDWNNGRHSPDAFASLSARGN